MMHPDYQAFRNALSGVIDERDIIDDPLRLLAYGSDASFYRLIPQLVLMVRNEAEVQAVLGAAVTHQIAVTFRAAGTSLSGQAISDSVLVMLAGDSWQESHISPDGALIRLQPGVIGAQANARLAAYGKKIGPDPASIGTAKIGGIAANNASGMCCGTARNSYHTLAGMRLMLADGSLVDTNDEASVTSFRASHAELLRALEALGQKVRANDTLSERIRHKYRLKNTCGYALNALVDHQDPLDILQHLMIGSEGTLGFIAQISYRTVPEHPYRSTALVPFDTLEAACQAVTTLKQEPVDAVELMDRPALRAVQDKPSMPEWLRDLGADAAALLVDIRAAEPVRLATLISRASACLSADKPARAVEFTSDDKEYERLWNVRKGLFPAVGAVRAAGSTVIIEDVAFPIERLAPATLELQALLQAHGYHEAIIFGHALEGNLHFVFTQDFGSHEEVQRYHRFMDAVAHLVTHGYGGSLKAEHGTGRNMAPYVELEWGQDAYRLMWDIKRLLDPHKLLNPGVLLNEDPELHVKNLKPMPAADERIDRCIECGFCEPICPSRNLSLTPRQRIVSLREIARLRRAGDDPARLKHFENDFSYQGMETCAADGLCASRCPVGIDTGAMIRHLRAQSAGSTSKRIASWTSKHIGAVTSVSRLGLQATALVSEKLVSSGMKQLTSQSAMAPPAPPKAAAKFATPPAIRSPINGSAVYFPSCVSRTFGNVRQADEPTQLQPLIYRLCQKAGFELILPERPDGLCCGLPFHSKGHPKQAGDAAQQLQTALMQASRDGELPIICDTSPCTLRLVEEMTAPLNIFEPAGFISRYLLPHLNIVQKQASVALHITCSSRRLGLDQSLRQLARACAEQVIEAEEQGCCGFSGDKGFTVPELNSAALARLREQIPNGCENGYSNSLTCEIGLSHHSGIHYRSIAYLVDECCESAAKVTPSAP